MPDSRKSISYNGRLRRPFIFIKQALYMAATGPGEAGKMDSHNCNNLSIGNFSILSRMLTLYWQVKKQERFLKIHLPALMAEVVPDHYQSFSASHIKRTTKYWQLGLNLICDNLYHLNGKKLNEEETTRRIL